MPKHLALRGGVVEYEGMFFLRRKEGANRGAEEDSNPVTFTSTS